MFGTMNVLQIGNYRGKMVWLVFVLVFLGCFWLHFMFCGGFLVCLWFFVLVLLGCFLVTAFSHF